MNLQTRNKVDTAFSMASMTDLIFLLLIFFMMTSSLI
ncbi:MAG: ExbD/TolR family protein, partial [Cyclobacteriaceae bacterium]